MSRLIFSISKLRFQDKQDYRNKYNLNDCGSKKELLMCFEKRSLIKQQQLNLQKGLVNCLDSMH